MLIFPGSFERHFHPEAGCPGSFADSVVVPSTCRAGREAEDERNRGHLGFLPVAVRNRLNQSNLKKEMFILSSRFCVPVHYRGEICRARARGSRLHHIRVREDALRLTLKEILHFIHPRSPDREWLCPQLRQVFSPQLTLSRAVVLSLPITVAL